MTAKASRSERRYTQFPTLTEISVNLAMNLEFYILSLTDSLFELPIINPLTKDHFLNRSH